MKKLIYILALAGMAASCHQPEELEPTTTSLGLTSLTASFNSGPYKGKPEAVFSAKVTDLTKDVVIPVPWFYPEDTDNQVTDISDMKVTAAMDYNCFLSPMLGLLDLTQPNYFTYTDGRGVQHNICIRGEIRKLTGCDMQAFTVTDAAGTRYDAIIDNNGRSIMISATDTEMENCTVESRVSPHAKVTVPDISGKVTVKEGLKVIVTAHDGVTKKEYTVHIKTPQKVDYGIRKDSERKAWMKYYSTDWSISQSNSRTRLAVSGNYLLISTGSGVYAIDRFTGNKVGQITVPGGIAVNSLTNDEGGNIFFAAEAHGAADGATTLEIYTTKAIEATPRKLITYDGANIYASNIGNIRVTGNIDTKAVVVANCGPGYALVWQVENGAVVGTPDAVTLPVEFTMWNNYTGATAGVSGNKADGLFYIGYTAPYNLNYTANGTTWSAVYTTGFAGNENLDNLSVVPFNKARYLAFEVGAHFSWGTCPEVFMFDAANPAMISSAQAFHMSAAEIKGSFIGVGASSDVLLYASEDGFKLSLYFTDANYDVVGCYEFDCIKMDE